MPTLVVKGIEAALVLVFGFSIFSWILPGKPPIDIELMTYQNGTYWGTMEFKGERSFIDVREAGEGKVKISFRRKGQDVSLIYERGQEVTDTDKMVIEKVLDEINKKPGWIQNGITGTLKDILNRPSKNKSRGGIRKFLP